MCGILGISDKSLIKDRFDESFLDQFNEALGLLSHRGPDAQGVKTIPQSGIALGHTRLSIQDLSSAGDQPMTCQDQKVTITFNGEIYNFPSLRQTLINLGYEFFSNTDTEVVLNLYKEFGIDCFEMLDGIFSLGIFDEESNNLILARDALGIKPLYYYYQDSCFIFSSEIKSMERLVGNHKLSLNKKSLNRYLTYQWCPGEGTPYTEIKKQNPGEVQVIRNGRVIQTKAFYSLPIHSFVQKAPRKKTCDISNRLDSELRKAVHEQMLSDAPVGAFLSGGLDSTSVVAFAREIDPNITCFTIDTQNSSNDGLVNDLPYAIAAAKHLNVPLEVAKVDSSYLVNNLEKMVWMLDEPLGDPAPLNVFYISELAKSAGMKVLLSGAGGDDIFTGYRRHQAVMYEEKIQFLPKSLLMTLERLTGKLDKRVTTFRRLAKLFSGSSLTGEDRIVNYFRWIDRSLLTTLYTDDFKNEIKDDIAEQPMLDFLKHSNRNSSRLDKVLALEQRFFTTDHNLLYTDKMSMAAGVEVRVPLLAKSLVEFVANIPDGLKQKGTEGKWIFKKTMETYLPKNIIYRPKTGFGAPLREWLKVELRDYVNDLLSNKSLTNRGLFNPDKVQLLLEKNYKGEIDASYTIFSLMCIEIWCRQHLDAQSFNVSTS